MRDQILLSVITPTFNSEKFIASCIENVAMQSSPFVEHIIVDGGSTDNTVKIITGHKIKNPNLVYISEKDKGQSDAMNKGIAMARGKIIGFLNVDDSYDSGVLNELRPRFESMGDEEILLGNCTVLKADGSLAFVYKPKAQNFFDLLRFRDFPVNPVAYFYPRSFHNMTGLYDIEDHYTMDLDFLCRAFFRGRVTYINRNFGFFRLLPGAKTYENLQSGRNEEFTSRVYKRYAGKLALTGRLRLVFLRLKDKFTGKIGLFIQQAYYFLARSKRKLKSRLQGK